MANEERGIVSRRAFAARYVEQAPAAADDLADDLEQAFAGLARGFRQLRQENLGLRRENHILRAALTECVEACGRYLATDQPVAVECPLQTRAWDDDEGLCRWQVWPRTPLSRVRG